MGMTSDPGHAARFGFLVASDKAAGAGLPGWRRHRFSDLHVWTHPECPLRRLAGHGWAAMVFGDIYVAHGESSVEALIQRVASHGNFDALDDLGGRFALLVSGPPGIRIFHDAFGSRSVYYRRGEAFAAASHVTLLSQAFGDEMDPATSEFCRSPEYGQRGTHYLPGDRTMYAPVHPLIPNNYYDIGAQRAIRYWPRAPLEVGEVRDFNRACDEYFSRTSEFLEGRYQLLLGLTGGLDARSLIAGLRWAGMRARLFTWQGGRVVGAELPLIDAIARHLGWPHLFVDVGRKSAEAVDPRMQQLTVLATGGARAPSALTANMSRLAGKADVFLRGYGGEIMRGFYNRHNRTFEHASAEEMASLYLTRRVARPSKGFLAFTIDAFEGFAERANFGGDFLGRDPLDIFYWEHRMGTWGSLMLNEMDPVLYSMTGLNSRRLYEAAFAMPREQRLGNGLLLDLIARYDQYLADVGVVS